MPHLTRALTIAAAAGTVLCSASAFAASDPTGLWFDHNGRGAVEIAPCGSGKGLCGYVVHINDEKNAKRCGMQILGNVTPDGGGWIYSPDRGRKYSVELTRLSDEKLRVIGNAGSMFSKTFTWNRAPDNVTRCGETTAAAPAKVEVAKAVPVAVRETASIPAPRMVATGASTASVALMGTPRTRVADVTPAAAHVTEEAPAAKKTAPVVSEAATEAPASTTETKKQAPEAAEDESFDAGIKRDCKFKIPYVGRVINVPCRN